VTTAKKSGVGGGRPGPGARLAVVPARAGSKRIPNKNVMKFGDKPLIAFTIEAAVGSALFGQVVVTTDSPEIADIARRYGAETPFLRDPILSDDFVPVSAATVDVLERLDSADDSFVEVCQLMPTCPLRTSADIVDSYAQFRKTDADSQLSVVRYGWQNPWWAMRRDDGFVVVPLFEQALSARSQDLSALFCPTGAVWWAKAGALRREGTFHMPGRTGWEIPWTRGVDIDSEDDWLLAEVLLRLVESGRFSE
jgi:CMP-N-acetylneuraminic acid synthetase